MDICLGHKLWGTEIGRLDLEKSQGASSVNSKDSFFCV